MAHELNGVTTDYSPKTRNRESEHTYVDGYREGPFKIYYEDDKTVKVEGEYTLGNVTKQGTYYPDGKLKKVEEGKGFDFKIVEQYDETGKRIK
jgi:antitoxin component YwqK of YwqJK toxin-antitoxin module